MTLSTIQVKQLSADGFQWNQYSPRVGTITNEIRHFATVTYFAFDSRDEAHSFFKSITDKRLCGRAQVRKSERFTTSHECKVWNLKQSTLEQLVERDRNRVVDRPIRRDWSTSESFDAHSYEAA